MKREEPVIQYESNENFDHEVTIKFYEAAKKAGQRDGNGKITPEWNEYQLYMINLLKGFAKKVISQTNRAMYSSMEDLMNDSAEAIITMLPDYNPHKTKPTTFFQKYLLQFTKNSLNNTAPSYYITNAAKLNKLLRDWGTSYTIDDPQLPPEMPVKLAAASNMSLTTIKATIQSTQIKIASLTQTSENFDTESSYNNSPENIYLNHEYKSDIWAAYYNILNPLEQELINLIDVAPSDERMSFRSICKTMEKYPEYYEKFKPYFKGKALSQLELQKIHQKALAKLKANNGIRMAYNKTVDNTMEEIDFARDEDFERMYEEEFLNIVPEEL